MFTVSSVLFTEIFWQIKQVLPVCQGYGVLGHNVFLPQRLHPMPCSVCGFAVWAAFDNGFYCICEYCTNGCVHNRKSDQSDLLQFIHSQIQICSDASDKNLTYGEIFVSYAHDARGSTPGRCTVRQQLWASC